MCIRDRCWVCLELGDFAGDLQTPDMWEREEGSGHLYLNVHDVYEVVDTHSDTIDDFNKEENRRDFAKMDFDEYNTAYGKVPPVEDAEHVFKNTEAGYEREDIKHKYPERVRAVNDAMKALVKFENNIKHEDLDVEALACLLYTSPSPRDRQKSRMPSSA